MIIRPPYHEVINIMLQEKLCVQHLSEWLTNKLNLFFNRFDTEAPALPANTTIKLTTVCQLPPSPPPPSPYSLSSCCEILPDTSFTATPHYLRSGGSPILR